MMFCAMPAQHAGKSRDSRWGFAGFGSRRKYEEYQGFSLYQICFSAFKRMDILVFGRPEGQLDTVSFNCPYVPMDTFMTGGEAYWPITFFAGNTLLPRCGSLTAPLSSLSCTDSQVRQW